MAKSGKYRVFEDNGMAVRFSSQSFLEVLDREKKERRDQEIPRTLDSLYEEIAEALSVSIDAVKNWRKGSNGVSDFQTIKDIAKALNIDYRELIVPADTPEKTIKLDFEPIGTDAKSLIIQLYQSLTDYIYWFVGTEYTCYAMTVLDDYLNEREKYTYHLYRLLDRMAFTISNDTYKELRKTITEVCCIAEKKRYYAPYPTLWVELNPRLGSADFNAIWQAEREETYTNSDYDYTDDLPYRKDVTNPDNLLHMFLEDRPDLIDKANMIKNGTAVTPHTFFDDKVDMDEMCNIMSDKRGLNINQIAGDNVMRYFGQPISAVIEHERYDLILPVYQIISREVSYTLIKVMRYRFPNFFPDNETNDNEEQNDYINCRFGFMEAVFTKEVNYQDLKTVRAIQILRVCPYFETVGELLDEVKNLEFMANEFPIYLTIFHFLIFRGTPPDFLSNLRDALVDNAPKEVKELPLSEFNLKTRTLNILKQESCETIGDAMNLSQDVKGMGISTWDEIQETITIALIHQLQTAASQKLKGKRYRTDAVV